MQFSASEKIVINRCDKVNDAFSFESIFVLCFDKRYRVSRLENTDIAITSYRLFKAIESSHSRPIMGSEKRSLRELIVC